jgi:hypothetical protein
LDWYGRGALGQLGEHPGGGQRPSEDERGGSDLFISKLGCVVAWSRVSR